jgi:putative polyhydroxyalkanoate system protein
MAIEMSQSHVLGLATAKERVETTAKHLEQKLGLSWKWEDDTVRFWADQGIVKGLKGTFAVEESVVNVRIEVPLLLKAMQGMIRSKVEENLQRLNA